MGPYLGDALPCSAGLLALLPLVEGAAFSCFLCTVAGPRASEVCARSPPPCAPWKAGEEASEREGDRDERGDEDAERVASTGAASGGTDTAAAVETRGGAMASLPAERPP